MSVSCNLSLFVLDVVTLKPVLTCMKHDIIIVSG